MEYNKYWVWVIIDYVLGMGHHRLCNGYGSSEVHSMRMESSSKQ